MRGVRRFPTSSHYPNKFNRSIGDDQSSVPSQHSEVPPPFDPSIHPDMIPTPPPQEAVLSIVRHIFDSRPPNAIDFYWEEVFESGVSSGQFTVPAGYICILRCITVTVYPIPTVDNIHTLAINIYGDTTARDSHIQVLVDGVATTNWTPDTQGQGGIPFFETMTGDLEVETFILIDQGQTFTVNIPEVTDDITSNVYVQYYGNMLLATGRSLNAEVGNRDPLLVSTEMG